jgi:transposase
MSGGNSDRVVVLVGRRFFSAEQKRAIVAEASRIGVNVSAVARAHNIKPSLLFRWKREVFEASMRAGSPPPPALVPVVVSLPSAPTAWELAPAPERHSVGPVMFEIVTARGFTLRVPSDADFDSIRRLVNALDGTS